MKQQIQNGLLAELVLCTHSGQLVPQNLLTQIIRQFKAFHNLLNFNNDEQKGTERLMRLASIAKAQVAYRGTFLFHGGEKVQSLYLILSGCVQLWTQKSADDIGAELAYLEQLKHAREELFKQNFGDVARINALNKVIQTMQEQVNKMSNKYDIDLLRRLQRYRASSNGVNLMKKVEEVRGFRAVLGLEQRSHTHTALVSEDCWYLEISRDQYLNIISSDEEKKHLIAEAITQQISQKFIAKQCLDDICEDIEEEIIEQNDIIYDESEEKNMLYVLQEGEVQLQVTVYDAQSTPAMQKVNTLATPTGKKKIRYVTFQKGGLFGNIERDTKEQRAICVSERAVVLKIALERLLVIASQHENIQLLEWLIRWRDSLSVFTLASNEPFSSTTNCGAATSASMAQSQSQQQHNSSGRQYGSLAISSTMPNLSKSTVPKKTVSDASRQLRVKKKFVEDFTTSPSQLSISQVQNEAAVTRESTCTKNNQQPSSQSQLFDTPVNKNIPTIHKKQLDFDQLKRLYFNRLHSSSEKGPTDNKRETSKDSVSQLFPLCGEQYVAARGLPLNSSQLTQLLLGNKKFLLESPKNQIESPKYKFESVKCKTESQQKSKDINQKQQSETKQQFQPESKKPFTESKKPFIESKKFLIESKKSLVESPKFKLHRPMDNFSRTHMTPVSQSDSQRYIESKACSKSPYTRTNENANFLQILGNSVANRQPIRQENGRPSLNKPAQRFLLYTQQDQQNVSSVSDQVARLRLACNSEGEEESEEQEQEEQEEEEEKEDEDEEQEDGSNYPLRPISAYYLKSEAQPYKQVQNTLFQPMRGRQLFSPSASMSPASKQLEYSKCSDMSLLHNNSLQGQLLTTMSGKTGFLSANKSTQKKSKKKNIQFVIPSQEITPQQSNQYFSSAQLQQMQRNSLHSHRTLFKDSSQKNLQGLLANKKESRQRKKNKNELQKNQINLNNTNIYELERMQQQQQQKNLKRNRQVQMSQLGKQTNKQEFFLRRDF